MGDPVAALFDSMARRAAEATIRGGSSSSPPSGPSRVRRRRPPSRTRHVRADWDRCLALLGMSGRMGRPARTEYGFEVAVTVDGCAAADALNGRARDVAGVFKVSAVQAIADREDLSRATLRLFTKDLLAETRPWPVLEWPEVCGWDAVELGWNAIGELVRFELEDRPHVGIFGQTRSGKSACQALFAAHAALSGGRLFLFDRNRKDLGRWAPLADRFVDEAGVERGGFVVGDMEHAAATLGYLLAELDRRFAVMHEHGADKLTRGLADELGLPLLWLIIDEGASYLKVQVESGGQKWKFVDALTELFARGAAAGLRGAFCTQTPTAAVIPTDLRSQMQAIVCKVKDSSMSRVALDTSVVDASRIGLDQQGVCYLDQDGVGVAKARTYLLGGDGAKVAIARALEMRGLTA